VIPLSTNLELTELPEISSNSVRVVRTVLTISLIEAAPAVLLSTLVECKDVAVALLSP